MTKRPALVIPAVFASIVLLVIAVVYLVDTADALPAFFPGHEAGSTHHHIQHGIAAAILGLCSLVYAWFQAGPSDPAHS